MVVYNAMRCDTIQQNEKKEKNETKQIQNEANRNLAKRNETKRNNTLNQLFFAPLPETLWSSPKASQCLLSPEIAEHYFKVSAQCFDQKSRSLRKPSCLVLIGRRSVHVKKKKKRDQNK